MNFESSVTYAGKRIALLTQHGKERVIAPLLDEALGCHVERVTGFDTDLLGTFSRDIPRSGTQLEAARKKARKGMELSGLQRGLASEGAFGPDPFAGMFPWNVEIVTFVDDERGLEIVGVAQGKASFSHLLAADWDAATAFAKQAGFPEHHLVLRPQGQDDPRIEKNLSTWAELETAFSRAHEQSENGLVFLENDFRAHANPTRMDTIRLAAMDLLKKLQSACPACNMPGFSMIERVTGLPCADCGEPTRETRAEIHGCLKCEYKETRVLLDVTNANPQWCDYCNP